MILQPFKHQEVTTNFFLDNPRAFCTSDPGTGKTRSVLDAIKQLQGRTLVIAPKSILEPSWGNDIKKFTPHLTYGVSEAKDRVKPFNDGVDVVLINHDGVKWVADNPHHLIGFSTLIIDESTAFKHHTAQRSKACASITPYFERRILLTGTPNPNSILDLWHQLKLLDDGERLSNSFWKFRASTHTPISRGAFTEWEEKEGIQTAIFGLIEDINIRYKFEDCLEIPENFTTDITFDLSPKHRAFYKELKRNSMLELNNDYVTAVNAASLATKLLQAASGIVYDSNNNPIELASDRHELILDLIEQRDQCLVAFNWKHQRDALIKLAKKRKINYGIIDGSVSTDQRSKAVDEFQDGKLKVIFAHPASASHGLTLTKGTSTIWASPTQNAEHYEQFCRRIYRAGQDKRTETVHITAADTLEERAYNNLVNKRTKMKDLLELLEL